MDKTHAHPHTETKKVVDRLSRAIGHLESVKKMVEEGRDCSEVLIQIAAVRGAINNVGKMILQDHINGLGKLIYIKNIWQILCKSEQ